MMKDFQSRGLFGPRDISKKILDVYFPRFDRKDQSHQQLTKLGKDAQSKTNEFLASNVQTKGGNALRLGALRLAIKKHLAPEMKEIDRIVKKLVG